MTDTVQVALVVATAPTLLAIGTLIVGIKNNTKAEQIHILVNSNLTAVKADLQLALDRVKKLEDILLTMITTREQLKNDVLMHADAEPAKAS